MNCTRLVNIGNDELQDVGALQIIPENASNWKISYSLVQSRQRNIILQQKRSYLLYTRREKLQNICPADIKTLQYITHIDSDDLYSKFRQDVDFGEYGAQSDEYISDLEQLEPPKLSTWEQYQKLVEAAKLKPNIRRLTLLPVTSLPKIEIHTHIRGRFKSRPRLATWANRSIIKMGFQKSMLVANTDYVEFRNFKLNKLYKKTITLQNVSTLPVRFQIQPRPPHSKFQVMIERSKGDRNILPPGMQLQLVVFFRCDDFDEPEEVLMVKVERGKPLIIKLHGYNEPPILLGTCLLSKSSLDILKMKTILLIQSWRLDTSSSSDSTESSEESFTYSTESRDTIYNKFASTTFDCKTAFIGETVYMAIKFKNIGGDGRFFVMSEIDWTTMYIQDITDTNVLKLPCFNIWPAYFAMKSQEEMMFYTSFSPECYGVHVDKVYILCNNCTILATEITGDGVIYEPNFIQISKKLNKERLFKRNIDKYTKYCIEVSASVPDIIGQSTICVTNTSEISMYFQWTTRNVESDENEINAQNHFPLNVLRVQPNSGIFAPNSLHHFTIIAEFSNLQPDLYFAVLQLYVEDIPEEALSEKIQFHVKQCTNRRRICSSVNLFVINPYKGNRSVDVWIADVEVWLRYTMEDLKSDETFDEIAGRITGRMSDYKDFVQDQYEETEMEESKDVEVYRSTSQLLLDELFLHYEIVNLKQFEPLWRERIVSMGVIRPTRALYIGIEETCALTVKNLSGDTLIYSWGEASGDDAEKLKLCVCPEKGQVSGRNAEKIKITLLPIKEGVVQSLHVPCFIGNSQKIIMLGIECYIEPLYVTFYFPFNNKEPVETKNNFIRVEWHVDSFQLAFDLTETSENGMTLLDKYRIQEEQELMNAYLDQDVLTDASSGPSISEMAAEESGEESTLSTRTSEIIQLSNLATEHGRYSQEKVDSSEIIPFFQTTLPGAQQPVVIEFMNLSLKAVEKKTFIIKNETSIPTNFRLRLKNFYPVMCSCKGKTLKYRIKSIYRRVYRQEKDLIETLHRVKRPESGIVIYVDPLNSNVGPFEAVPVNIYVFGDTWGIYVDKLEINIIGLPVYTLEICVQIVGSPIWLSIPNQNQSTIPVLKYGITMKGVRPNVRTILLKNISAVPVAIDWHSFLIKPVTNKMPFNVVIDICTPLTDKLASEMRAIKSKTASSIHIEHDKFCSEIRDPNEFDSVETTINSTPYTYSGSSYMAVSWKSNDESLNNTEISLDYTSKSLVKTTKNKYIKDEKATELDMNNHDIVQKNDKIEFKMSILPYYGPMDTKVCIVTPKEMFILPNDNASLTINIQPDKSNDDDEKNQNIEFFCKIFGFLRIAPSDKYRDNRYFRRDGNYFPSIEIDVVTNIIEPKLTFSISKTDRTFMCCAHDVMQSEEKKLELIKTLFLYNYGPESIRVVFETYNPFRVKSVSIYAETNLCKYSGSICINSKGCAEVQIVCIVDAELIETIIHTSKSQDLYDSVITITEPLQITHTDKHQQNIELILQVWLPVLKLSSYALNFDLVYIGDTKKLILVIKNLSICNQNIRINQKLKNYDFIIDHKNGKLSSYFNRKHNCFMLTVSFQPKKPGQSIEILEVTTDIPYNTEECEICGEGTLDEKYHTPGV